MPTRFELEILVYCSSGKDMGRDSDGENRLDLDRCEGDYQNPTISLKAFPDMEKHAFYWSSPPDAHIDSFA